MVGLRGRAQLTGRRSGAAEERKRENQLLAHQEVLKKHITTVLFGDILKTTFSSWAQETKRAREERTREAQLEQHQQAVMQRVVAALTGDILKTTFSSWATETKW